MKILERSVELARALYPNPFDSRRCFHWSFLYLRNKLISVGENKDKTHPKNRFNVRNFPPDTKATCSEFSALFKAKKTLNNIRWNRLVLVNVRIDRGGKIRNSAPCAACQNLLRYFNVVEVYHTTDKDEFIKYGPK